MAGAGSAMGKGDPISTTKKSAKCTGRTSGHISEPDPKKCSRRSELTNGKRDKLVQVDMWDRATVAIGGVGKLMRLPSR